MEEGKPALVIYNYVTGSTVPGLGQGDVRSLGGLVGACSANVRQVMFEPRPGQVVTAMTSRERASMMGVRTLGDVGLSSRMLALLMSSVTGVARMPTNVRVDNVQAVMRIGRKVDVARLARSPSELLVTYNKDSISHAKLSFAMHVAGGQVRRPVALVYPSGNVVITGIKNMEEAEAARDIVWPFIKPFTTDEVVQLRDPEAQVLRRRAPDWNRLAAARWRTPHTRLMKDRRLRGPLRTLQENPLLPAPVIRVKN